ncbi:MAG: hypothetical protein NTV43_17600 [Methylococcales bacterium]|nr:hypothetical protein [Methylococcales bacterium]
MIKAYWQNRGKAQALSAQIRLAEQQVSARQDKINVRSVTLIRTIHQQLSSPASLLLAGILGFMVGELSRPCTNPHPNNTPETSPLKTALSLFASVRTLYTALPVAWMIKSYRQSGAVTPKPKRQTPLVSTACQAAASRRKSKQ